MFRLGAQMRICWVSNDFYKCRDLSGDIRASELPYRASREGEADQYALSYCIQSNVGGLNAQAENDIILECISKPYHSMKMYAPILTDTVHCSDSLDLLRALPSESVHLILSDIPYGIGAADWDVMHANTNSAYRGSSPAQAKSGAIFKSRGKPINGWSDADRAIPREYQEWCSTWAGEWLRVLKPGASAIVFAGRRLAHRCTAALEDAGFSLKDNLAWIRTRAAHRAQRLSIVYERRGDMENAAEWEGWKVGNLRPIFEPVLWFTKPYRQGGTIADNAKHHGVGAYNEKAFLRYSERADNVLSIGNAQGEGGLHPTQKPVLLMQALIELTTKENQIVLDPYCGSGTTLVAARNLHRSFIGCDNNAEYVATAMQRLALRLI